MSPVEMDGYECRRSHLELKLVYSSRKRLSKLSEPGLERRKAGGGWASLQSSLQVPTSSDVQIKGNDWLRRQSVPKGRLNVFSIPPVFTVIQGSEATFQVPYSGEDKKTRRNLSSA